MSLAPDPTNDPALRSWVTSAEDESTDFPLQNLPLGCFERDGVVHPGMAIGDMILDLDRARAAGLLPPASAALIEQCVRDRALNPLLGAGRDALAALRATASLLLRSETPEAHAARALPDLLVSQRDVRMLLPARIGDYTDFYASIDHASNVGGMFRPDNPLLPNYKWVPIGYHGRASSIVPSGATVRRPSGQSRDEGMAAPAFGPTRRLDYELEVGAFIGKGTPMGGSIPIGSAMQHVAGLCLVNDWSARDVQAWEYQPLGPFLAKNFATTVSPWIVTLDALAPFRAPRFDRTAGDPQPLAYLDDAVDAAQGGFDITLEVLLRSETMRAASLPAMRVSRGSFASMYWTLAQMVTHHASNGCNLQPGDLLASGTVSGSTPESRGCLLERTWRGTEPLALPTGEQRRFLEDGDEVTMRGWCERPGYRRIGFGDCTGVVVGG